MSESTSNSPSKGYIDSGCLSLCTFRRSCSGLARTQQYPRNHSGHNSSYSSTRKSLPPLFAEKILSVRIVLCLRMRESGLTIEENRDVLLSARVELGCRPASEVLDSRGFLSSCYPGLRFDGGIAYSFSESGLLNRCRRQIHEPVKVRRIACNTFRYHAA